ncbi:hypothetical protein [Streptacidiphilus sp. MAP5-3]|uniref:hypothetical protein n=1 Tax=unclassified Streptacidiphilus TaxID=2643834 RepID=UPI0035140D94
MTAVVACALHATAVEYRLDAPAGGELLRIPLAPAGELLGDGVLDVLASASPPAPDLSSLLHSIPYWIEQGDDDARTKGEFIVDQARGVLALHTEFGYAVGDRLRAILETGQAMDDLQRGNAAVTYPPDACIYETAQPLDDHVMAASNLEAMHLADQAAGTPSLGLERQRLLVQAALSDRIVLGLGERASEDQREQARAKAGTLLDWDREHGTHTGPLAAEDGRWKEDPLGYVRQEYHTHLDRLSQPLLGD